MNYAMSYSLFSRVGVLQHKAEFAKSSTVSVAVQNMGGEFFHPKGRVSGITTNLSSSNFEGNIRPSLGAPVRHKPMR